MGLLHGSLLLCGVMGCKLYDATLIEGIEPPDGATAAPAEDAALPRGDAGDTGPKDASAADAGGESSLTCRGGDCFWSEPMSDAMCRSAGVPDATWRPDPSDHGGADEDAIYLGLARMWLGTTTLAGETDDAAWQEFGLDLDGVCSYADSCGIEDGPAVSCRANSPQLPFDGMLCRDNTFARLQPIAAGVPQIGETFGLSEDIFNCELWRGSFNMVLKISGYNGQSNDDRVRVDFYASPGVEVGRPWSCPLEGYRENYPIWPTSRRWHVDASSLTEAIENPDAWPASTTHDVDAFVRHGYLVARPPDGALFELRGPESTYAGWSMPLDKGYWIGRLRRRADTTWEMSDGLLAGRIRTEALLASLQKAGLCPEGESAAFYTAVREYATENADLLASGENDADQDCDAMSVGIAFEARQITPGSAFSHEPWAECEPSAP